jgi:RHS repeat-associated protein
LGQGTRLAGHDSQDRLINDGPYGFEYTAAGELSSRTNYSTSQRTYYEYDELGNLIEVVLPDWTEIEYVIDGLGRRIGKKVDSVVERGWLYGQHIGPVAELNGSGAIESRFVYGVRAHVPDFMQRDGATYRLLTDHLGSVRLVVNTSTGDVAQRLDYDPWGVVTLDTNPGFQPFGYAGGLYDPDTSLVRFGARDYDPWAARWTAKDPILFAGGDTNLYAYVGGDPINRFDPLGLAWYDALHWVERLNDSALGQGVIGFGDTVSGVPFTNYSLSQWARNAVVDGAEDVVNRCSTGYAVGQAAGILHQAMNLNPKLPGWLLGRAFKGGGLLNRSDFLRLGWGWAGSAKSGNHVVRVARGRPTKWHWDLLRYPRAWWGGT